VIDDSVYSISLHFQSYCVKEVKGQLHLLLISLSQDFPAIQVSSASFLDDICH
jgi:hypothetical protein